MGLFRRQADAFDRWRDDAPDRSSAPTPAAEEQADDPAVEQSVDWTTAPADEVPPWRREDRALVDGARAAAAVTPPDEDASARARDLRRLAELSP